MQPKWIALGLFVAGLCFILALGLPNLSMSRSGWRPASYQRGQAIPRRPRPT
jgi:hypothetical protein